jgi:hypothetical protein
MGVRGGVHGTPRRCARDSAYRSAETEGEALVRIVATRTGLAQPEAEVG